MIEWVVERLTNLVGPISDLRKERRELADSALRAVSAALTETSIYYRDVEANGIVENAREARLVRLWAAAAIPLRHVDPELSGICQHKSEYWLNPRSWSHHNVKQLGIDLENVRKRYTSLLTP
jgi:hypothetical protein